MAKDWPGITDKAAFCAWLSHQESGKWPAEKSAFSLRLPIAKFDDQSGIVTGWAALSSANGQPLVDYHDELSMVSELEKTAHRLMMTGGVNKAGEMHNTRVGDIVESMVLSKEKVSALFGLPLDDIKTEGWAVSMKLRDPAAIARVKSGERSEMSIHGMARKIPVGERDGVVVKALVDLDVDEISIVDRGASGNDDAKPRIVIAKRRNTEPIKGLGDRFLSQIRKLFGKGGPMNPLDDILAKLTDEERAVVMAAIEAAAKKEPEPVIAAAAPVPAPAKEEEKDHEAVMKSLPESVRKQLIEAKQAKEEIAKIRKELDERNDREEVAKFKAKAERFPFLAGKSTEEIAKTLRAAAKSLQPKEYETIEKMLENANEAVKGSPLFKDYGARGNESDMSAKGRIEALAKALREADPKLTHSQAVSKALDDNKDLHAQYNAEIYSA